MSNVKSNGFSEMHFSVLQKEVIECLNPKPNENFIDATFGLGGHTKLILRRNGPKGKVLGIELDPSLHELSRNLSERLILVNDSYANLELVVAKLNFKPVHGILFDLGMSGWHLEKSGRGFSLKRDEVLDMRYNPQTDLTAQEIVNRWPQIEIEKILKEYGEERFARRIARSIILSREKKPIKTTFQLVEIIRKAVPAKYQRGRLHFATRTFQALRIAVNRELENLREALPQALKVIEKGGRLVVISFHSLEDRIVKNFFRDSDKKGLLKILTKKPITPSLQELRENPRARSAKLRAAEKTN